MALYYDVKAKFETENDNTGKVVKVSERYILQAESATDAENIAVKRYSDEVNEFRVTHIAETNIYDVYKNEKISN